MVLSASIFLITSAPVHAATAEDTTLNLITSPLPIDLKATPGSTVSTEIRIKNGSPHSETLKVRLMKFSAFGEEGKPSIQDRGPGDTYFDWVNFSSERFVAPSNKWVTIKMSITVPKDAAFGYYYAAVFSRADTPKPATSRQNVLVGSTAVLVLVDVDVPGAKRTAEIKSFTVNKHTFEFLPADFAIKIRNTGNVHLVPTGNIFIKRGNKTVATLNVNSPGGNVLPASNRIFTASWTDGFPVYTPKEAGGQVVLDKNDKPVTELKADFTKVSKLRIGRYTAHVLLAYDNGKSDVPLEATVSFWVIPWRLILIAIAIPVVPAVAVYLFTNWRFKRRLARERATKKSRIEQ
jgi:hypothetical protein